MVTGVPLKKVTTINLKLCRLLSWQGNPAQ